MGCYGIGTSRLMGVIVEKFNDEKGIIWPKSVAPFNVHLIALKGGEIEAEKVYKTLLKEGIEVLYDDRDASAGEKFADSDLIGIPVRLVTSSKTVQKHSVEVKHRDQSEAKLVKLDEVEKVLK